MLECVKIIVCENRIKIYVSKILKKVVINKIFNVIIYL